MTINDRWIGLAVIAISLVMGVQSFTMNYPVFSNDPGPAFFPGIISVLLLVCGLGLVFWPRAKEAGQAQGGEEDKLAAADAETADSGEKRSQHAGTARMLGLAASIVVYAAIFEFVGFMTSTFLFLAFSIWLLSETRNWRTLGVGVVTSAIATGVVYAVFDKLLNVNLPTGFLL